VWSAGPAALEGGLIVNMGAFLDRAFRLPIFSRLVRFIWNRAQPARQEVTLEVKNCGWMLTAGPMEFHRQPDGSYVNYHDPIRAPTGAAVYYVMRVDSRSAMSTRGHLVAPAPIVGSIGSQELTLVSASADDWLRTCEVVPPCSDLDGTCG
jgi:hypothetical protein